MQITNTTGWRTPWLQKVIKFCCRELGYPERRILRLGFRLAHTSGYRGRAVYDTHTITVNISPLIVYPIRARRQRGLPELKLVDAVEVLVSITAHEIAHLERWDRFVRGLKRSGGRDSQKEYDTERLARTVLTAFRSDRNSLMAAWGEAGVGPIRPSLIHRLTCRRCGGTWESARKPRDSHRTTCGKCFPSWSAANAVGEFLAYERIQESEE